MSEAEIGPSQAEQKGLSKEPYNEKQWENRTEAEKIEEARRLISIYGEMKGSN